MTYQLKYNCYIYQYLKKLTQSMLPKYISFLFIITTLSNCTDSNSKANSNIAAHPPKQKKPNVLFVSIDDLRPSLGVYGDSIVHSPNIDKLASEGITFRRTFAQSAVCAPSRASLMTGVRPDSTRVWHLGDKFREINPSAVTMPQYFSKHGYHTVNLGKIFHNYMPDSISWDEPDLRPSRYLRLHIRETPN